MIYLTTSTLYARFLHHSLRNPPQYPQFQMDGSNKMRPDVTEFTSSTHALLWASSLANNHGTSHIRLKHNCLMMYIEGIWSIYWLPLYTGVKLCHLIHSPSTYDLGCYDNMPRKSVIVESTVVEVHHIYVPHPLDPGRGFPCNRCGFPVPAPFRKRCSRCRIACYCSRRCQELDWPNHKDDCVAVQYPRSVKEPRLAP